MSEFSFTQREQWMKEVDQEQFDVVIVGGGITGIGTALDAVTRGMSVALIEMQDFAGGTSSRSTKLVHGGLRYLKQFEVKMVSEVGKEREIVYNNAPHVTHPEWMLLPIYRKGTFGKYSTSAGLRIYDFLAGVKKEERRRMLTREETLAKEPLLKQDGLIGGGYYVEYRTDDARLTIEVAKKAVEKGAILLNYVKADSFIYEADRIIGVIGEDQFSGRKVHLLGTKIINATGPWIESLVKKDRIIKGKHLFHTKGVHIVIDQSNFPLEQAIYFDTSDGRMVFAIPRDGKTYVGTTDTEYHGDLKNPVATLEDKQYIIEAIKYMFPDVQVQINDIESSWAGIRPLIREEGKGPSEISRKDEIWISPTGLITIAGGKLTGYRKMAEQIIDVVAADMNKQGFNFGVCLTKHLRISGGDFETPTDYNVYVKEKKNEFTHVGFSQEEAHYLSSIYGTNSDILLQLAREIEETEELPRFIRLLIQYSVKYEMVMNVSDFLVRRTGAILFDIQWVKKWRKSIEEEFRKIFKWNEETVESNNKELERMIMEIEQLV
ncbi:glycerol-3-phosphate dehydrogenase [Cytobacillus eiseniae]|uniref:Aerobic glycerol-3-phosphate dehydrogenase n=1 Tax=Cytobacillus eiseniae TaxID=762947 RepID=A0ABS4RHI3_9BACI|nr:glycerol-3-phosphate dehydrogenase/oxidase [Cytobacillus eiseniae]MBP2241784.1 glycerol-3-phosphate dehydrogenase [Cytobacillus eiseniae]